MNVAGRRRQFHASRPGVFSHSLRSSILSLLRAAIHGQCVHRNHAVISVDFGVLYFYAVPAVLTSRSRVLFGLTDPQRLRNYPLGGDSASVLQVTVCSKTTALFCFYDNFGNSRPRFIISRPLSSFRHVFSRMAALSSAKCSL